MVEKYIQKEICPFCSKKIKIDWKYCPSCGNFIDNYGLRVRVSKFYNETIESKNTEPNKAMDLINKFNSSISRQLADAERLSNQSINPLIIQIDDSVKIYDFKSEDDNTSGLAKFFNHDYNGYHFNPSGLKKPTYNSQAVDKNEKIYLTNGDSIRVDDKLYIYTILDQKDVSWNKVSLNDENIEKNLLSPYLYISNDNLVIKFDENQEILLNNHAIKSDVIFNNYDLLTIDKRNFVLINGDLHFQDPLEESNKTSKAVNANQISPDDILSVDIKKMVVKVDQGKEKTLLKDIKFQVKPTEMVLILGGSGAGKTTLINSIMGSLKADATIKIGNYNLYDNFDKVKRMIANVPQFNLHRQKDTVMMTLTDAGFMKLPADFVKDKRLFEPYVEEILRKLKLYKSKDSLVEALSGGEKKRLSIASEYIGDPVIFILDEPDSGLDGANSRSIMNSLREIADDNKIVMLISHSPDRTPDLFDKVLVLAKSERENCGQLAFYGDVENTLEYFDVDSLELVVEKIESTPDYYIEKFKEYNKELD